jgi:hypothetical protein
MVDMKEFHFRVHIPKQNPLIQEELTIAIRVQKHVSLEWKFASLIAQVKLFADPL